MKTFKKRQKGTIFVYFFHHNIYLSLIESSNSEIKTLRYKK